MRPVWGRRCSKSGLDLTHRTKACNPGCWAESNNAQDSLAGLDLSRKFRSQVEASRPPQNWFSGREILPTLPIELKALTCAAADGFPGWKSRARVINFKLVIMDKGSRIQVVEPNDLKRGVEPQGLEFLHDVKLGVAVEFGSACITIRNLLGLKIGSIITLDQAQGEDLGVRLNGRLVARGEAVIINDKMGIRLTDIIDSDETAHS